MWTRKGLHASGVVALLLLVELQLAVEGATVEYRTEFVDVWYQKGVGCKGKGSENCRQLIKGEGKCVSHDGDSCVFAFNSTFHHEAEPVEIIGFMRSLFMENHGGDRTTAQ
jgi:L-ascorbate metabolism protein UlaG (beta-lactamase superfamily)